MARLQLGLIGCGQIGAVHAQRLVQNGRAELVCLCDQSLPAAEQLRQRWFPRARVVTDVSDALQQSKLDGVIIATPTQLHHTQVLQALARSVPILCEKPLATTREQILEIITACHRPDAPPLMVGYQRRFWSTYRTLKREIDSGRWGRITAISVHNTEHWLQSQATPGSWRNDPERNPGGYLGDAGSHKLDAMFFLTGCQPVEVSADLTTQGAQVPITCTLTGRLTRDITLAMSFFGHAHHFREDVHVVLESGDLMLRERQLWRGHQNEWEPIQNLEPHSDATLGFVELLRTIQRGEEYHNHAPADCALPVFDFTAGILESARRRERMTFPS